MDRRPCMCLPFGTTKAMADGAEAGQVGAPEAGLSGFEAGRCVLPRRLLLMIVLSLALRPYATFMLRRACSAISLCVIQLL